MGVLPPQMLAPRVPRPRFNRELRLEGVLQDQVVDRLDPFLAAA
jgi:hypothetical protein